MNANIEIVLEDSVDENVKILWDKWPALALNRSAQRIYAETASIFDNLSGGFDGKRKQDIFDLVKETENRAVWLRMLAFEQMKDDMRKEK